MNELNEDVPLLPPPKGEPPLLPPPVDLTGPLSTRPPQPRPRPPADGPLPPWERPPAPTPPIEVPPIEQPPGEAPTLLDRIQQWFRNLPRWLKVVLFVVAVVILLAMLWKFLKWLFSNPDSRPPEEEIPPQVVPIAIQFNLDPTAPIALNIRRSFTEEVTIPEWTLEDLVPEESPVCYSIQAVGQDDIRIKVKLILVPAQDALVEVRAVGGGVLGDATRQEPVRFLKGVTVPEYVDFFLRSHTIGTSGVRLTDITWRWEYRLPGESQWREIGNTHHRVYEVLKTPEPPWTQVPFPDNQNPWTDALDIACMWASGATTPEESASRVTRAVNVPAGNVKYDVNGGWCHYTSGPLEKPGVFELSKYIDRVQTGKGGDELVNCSDCAAIVSTLANLVGADLGQSVMAYRFDLNRIMAIGYNNFGNPNWDRFRYHEVAWTGGGGEGDPLADACLKTNKNGPSTPEIPVLHTNSAFSNPYRPQLVRPGSSNPCTPRPHLMKWRKLK